MKKAFFILTVAFIFFGFYLQFENHYFSRTRLKAPVSDSDTDWRELHRKLLERYDLRTSDARGLRYTLLDAGALPKDAQNRNQYLFAVQYAFAPLVLNRGGQNAA